jgi:hypothetical protein
LPAYLAAHEWDRVYDELLALLAVIVLRDFPTIVKVIRQLLLLLLSIITAAADTASARLTLCCCCYCCCLMLCI